ncbi:hypothetical protein ACWDE9_25900 [Streptomyces olivaceoviridis]
MPTRRTVLATTAAGAVLAGPPTQGHAAPAERRAYRRRTAVIGATDSAPAVLRCDDEARTSVRGDDNARPWGWTGQAVTGDPRVHGRVRLATIGRGIQYGEPA